MIFFVVSLLLWTIGGSYGDGFADSRIIGGEPARAGQFPFASAVRIKTLDSAIFCGGALISSQFVITSAHCIDYAVEIQITLGTNILSDNSTHIVVLSSSRYHIHPDFDNETLENDIAIIEFRQPVQYGDYVSKIHLPVVAYGANVNITAIGWGQTSDDESSTEDILNFVPMVTISNDECKLVYGGQIKDSMICIVGQYDEGICTGDSGSPLVYFLNYVHPILIGVASFRSGEGCETFQPSGYTRVFPYRDWILNITGPIQ